MLNGQLKLLKGSNTIVQLMDCLGTAFVLFYYSNIIVNVIILQFNQKLTQIVEYFLCYYIWVV